MDDGRLARIEANVEGVKQELDKVGDALITLARMDERLVTLFKRMDNHMEDVKSINARLTALEKNSIAGGVWGYIGDKMLWLAMGAGIAVLAKVLGAT